MYIVCLQYKAEETSHSWKCLNYCHISVAENVKVSFIMGFISILRRYRGGKCNKKHSCNNLSVRLHQYIYIVTGEPTA
jgi:hypothetical protein